MEAILKELCYGEGRGPELQQVHYKHRGRILVAIDYFNPDDVYEPENLKHLLFVRPQVYMFTPEEVYNSLTAHTPWAAFGNAAVVYLGKTDWLRSFAQQHLGRSNHYQIMFYDQYLDIICEGIEAKHGGYAEHQA